MKKILTKRSILLALLLIGLVILPFMGLSNYMVRVLVNCLLYSGARAFPEYVQRHLWTDLPRSHWLFLHWRLHFRIDVSAAERPIWSLFPVCRRAGSRRRDPDRHSGLKAVRRLSGHHYDQFFRDHSSCDRELGQLYTRADGLPGIPPISLFGWRFSSNIPYYFFMLVFCIIVVILMKHIINSAFWPRPAGHS